MDEREMGREQNRVMESNKQRTIIYIVLILFTWAGLFYGGYYFTSNYLQQTHPVVASQIEEIKHENQLIEQNITETMQFFYDEINKSNEEIIEIRNEIAMIQEMLEITGETMDGTDETRHSLQDQMIELERQLTTFEEQLEKLEEAVRAF
ncbi:hypothetical protein SYNTR_1170 [Candidatus Syntrophocurvum alkaliphilum]|uniref:Uncharacterized protein n=1 Tax=Candidatus Syntrophocurvum alkaliphilum TaxID=2293317 RepID=A0A6I6DHK5_9FIRM|nr:hypothetical protein [Candidatus Syntrophocurvum alkaliphilum]QGT99763.1 hypothetical protein SYNTR_1170 [Candidatus Syntrophocurvum alkaliphilum]